MRRLAALLVALLSAVPAQAQYWATRDVCRVEAARIDPGVFAPATLAELEAEAATLANGTGKYWRITAPGGAVSHLWGTMHVNDPLILDLPDRVERDIRAARVVAVEADFIFKTRADYSFFAHAKDIYGDENAPTGLHLLDLPDQVATWIRLRTEGMGWGSDAPDYIPLAGIANLVLGDPCNDFAGGVYPSQDGRIQMLGAIEGAEILGLEHPESFDNRLRDPASFELLNAIIATYGAYLNPETAPGSYATSYALYLQGRIGVSMAWEKAYMTALYGPEQGARWLRQTDAYLLDERNRTFLGTALPELRKGRVFMAIGNFHLPGENGMVELLRRAGFSVERVTLPGEVPG